MIQAILLIFLGMTNAEQAYIANAACTVGHVPVSSYISTEDRIGNKYADGSYIEYPFYDDDPLGDVVFNTRGQIVHYSTFYN